MRTTYKIPVCLILITSFLSCKQEFPERNQTGMIRYVLKPITTDSVFHRMPTQMIYYFDGSKTCKSLVLGEGNMRIRSIADASKKEHTLLLEGLNKNIAMQISSNELNFGMPDLLITETGNKVKFDEYDASEICIKQGQREFCDILFTKEIGSPGLNWNSPYDAVDGILLKYIMTYRNIALDVRARSIEIGPVDPDVFLLPLNTVEVSASEEMIIY